MGEALARYGFGEGHPWTRDRLWAFWEEACLRGLDAFVDIEEPPAATEEDLLLFHERDHVAFVKKKSGEGMGFLDEGDTPAFSGIFEAATQVVGSAITGARFLMTHKGHFVFCPIGGLHHARRAASGGFCVFNDIGVAAGILRRDYGLKRILYVDIDAHHGDGVYYGFEEDPDFFIADVHEDGKYLYPGTGSPNEKGKGQAYGTKLNLALPPGAKDDAFLNAWDAAKSFMEGIYPDFVILVCGTDGLAGDPLSHLKYSPAVFEEVGHWLAAYARRRASGRLMALGGGGYSLRNLATGWSTVLTALAEESA